LGNDVFVLHWGMMFLCSIGEWCFCILCSIGDWCFFISQLANVFLVGDSHFHYFIVLIKVENRNRKFE
jgi:hypothetical protein